jgi:polar amino acid transport system ATP-binding protein
MKLKLQNVSFDIGQERILNNISITFNQKVLTLIGPSGSGKSTLLRLLVSLEKPLTGSIEVNEKIITQSKDLIDYRKKIGVIFQAFNLFPHLSALENIILPLTKIHGNNKEEANEKAQSLLKRFNLLGHQYKKPMSLSGGQKQRMAIMRAIITKPEVLFLDEPTSALDPEMTGEVLELIQELKNENMGMVFVTHEMKIAKKISDEILFLNRGEVLKQAAPIEVFDSTDPIISQFMKRVYL